MVIYSKYNFITTFIFGKQGYYHRVLYSLIIEMANIVKEVLSKF